MKANRRVRLQTLMAISNLTRGLIGPELLAPAHSTAALMNKEAKEPWNLTHEEQVKLDTLTGKEKKRFVKELREKYD